MIHNETEIFKNLSIEDKVAKLRKDLSEIRSSNTAYNDDTILEISEEDKQEIINSSEEILKELIEKLEKAQEGYDEEQKKIIKDYNVLKEYREELSKSSNDLNNFAKEIKNKKIILNSKQQDFYKALKNKNFFGTTQNKEHSLFIKYIKNHICSLQEEENLFIYLTKVLNEHKNNYSKYFQTCKNSVNGLKEKRKKIEILERSITAINKKIEFQKLYFTNKDLYLKNNRELISNSNNRISSTRPPINTQPTNSGSNLNKTNLNKTNLNKTAILPNTKNQDREFNYIAPATLKNQISKPFLHPLQISKPLNKKLYNSKRKLNIKINDKNNSKQISKPLISTNRNEINKNLTFKKSKQISYSPIKRSFNPKSSMQLKNTKTNISKSAILNNKEYAENNIIHSVSENNMFYTSKFQEKISPNTEPLKTIKERNIRHTH